MEMTKSSATYSIAQRKYPLSQRNMFSVSYLALNIVNRVAYQSRYIQHLLVQVRKHYADRNGTFLSQYGDSEIDNEMSRLTKGEVWKLFEQDTYKLEELLMVKGDIHYNGPGIYMHIIWDRQDHKRYYLYVGQSMNVHERIVRHEDPWYQQKHPCLHCYVLNSGGMESQFVLLAEINAQKPMPGLLLSILEMWCCPLFQTLTKGSLARYLPDDIEVRYPGIHLNVATPLQQRIYNEQDKSISIWKSFADLYRSADPLVQQYYRSLRQSFYDLLHYNHYDFCLPRSLGFWSAGMTVKVFLDILEIPHPHQYAKAALTSDPAARLGVRIIGKDVNGTAFEHWISSKGKVKAMMMNTLVDLLGGIPIEVTEKQPQRSLPKDLSRNRHKITTTF